VTGLSPLLGKSWRIELLELILPLGNEGFTMDEIVVALPKINRLQLVVAMKDLLSLKFIDRNFAPGYIWYNLNPESNTVWALNNLIHSIFEDERLMASRERMGKTASDRKGEPK
jgi:hypothetical protein